MSLDAVILILARVQLVYQGKCVTKITEGILGHIPFYLFILSTNNY
jgi:hypothetical protein